MTDEKQLRCNAARRGFGECLLPEGHDGPHSAASSVGGVAKAMLALLDSDSDEQLAGVEPGDFLTEHAVRDAHARYVGRREALAMLDPDEPDPASDQGMYFRQDQEAAEEAEGAQMMLEQEQAAYELGRDGIEFEDGKTQADYPPRRSGAGDVADMLRIRDRAELLGILELVGAALEASRRSTPLGLSTKPWVEFDYTNHRAEVAHRRVLCACLRLQAPDAEWYAGEWVIHGFCQDRQEHRDFSILCIDNIRPLITLTE